MGEAPDAAPALATSGPCPVEWYAESVLDQTNATSSTTGFTATVGDAAATTNPGVMQVQHWCGAGTSVRATCS
ncbi:MAG: hypothetical protein V9G04_07995 [Nocardioides sp.]|jgi:hypothetical protein